MEDSENNGMTSGTGSRFWGTHEHSLDAKGRVILPSRFREPFRGGAFLTKAGEGCLSLFTPAEFDRRTSDMLDKVRSGQAERSVARAWAAAAVEVAPDGQGRIPVAGQLREYAQLDGDVVVNGAIDHVELWNPDKWREVDAEGSQFLLSGQDALADVGF